MDITNAGQALMASEEQSAIRQEITAFLNENCRTGASIASIWESLEQPMHAGNLEHYIPLLPPIWQLRPPLDDLGRQLERRKLLQVAEQLFAKRLAGTNPVILSSTDRTDQDNRERRPIGSISSVSRMEGIEMDEPTDMDPLTLEKAEDSPVNRTELR